MAENNDGCAGCGKGITVVNAPQNITKQETVPCEGCAKKFLHQKLGTCKQCIVSNIMGAVLGWVLFIIFFFFHPNKNLAFAVLIITGLFTLLLAAHGVAYLIKRKK